MIEIISLYVVLIQKPRYDESHWIQDFPTYEDCQFVAELYNQGYILNALGDPMYRYDCIRHNDVDKL